jgi:C4-dicarboxylate-specific signal transduction histidine kinase
MTYGKVFRKLRYIEKKMSEELTEHKKQQLEEEYENLKKLIPKLVYLPSLHRNEPYKNDI